MEVPFFSIILPAYNAAATLTACLESIANQSCKNFDVFVMDAVSKDDTLSIVSKYAERIQIKCISEKDNGIYDAMNKGITKASGRWIYFLGSDDALYDKDVLQDMYESLKNKNVDMAYGNVFLKNGKIFYDGEFSKEKLVMDRNICHQSIFYNKNIFDKVGYFNIAYKIWADYDLNIRIFSNPHSDVMYVNRTIALYNEQTGASAQEDEVFKFFLAGHWRRLYEQKKQEIPAFVNSRYYKLIRSVYRKIFR